MAKTSYLNLTNKILRRINQSEISDVTAATGHAEIITNLINEAQNVLYTELNWYSLITTTTLSTEADTASYSIAADVGKMLDVRDTTNNIFIYENYQRVIDMADADESTTGQPTSFAMVPGTITLYPIPAGTYTIKYRYWKVPVTLAANADTSDLPIEVENCIIQWTLYMTLDYMNKFDMADRARLEYVRLLKTAKITNDRITDRMDILRSGDLYRDGIAPPRFPSNYGRGC